MRLIPVLLAALLLAGCADASEANKRQFIDYMDGLRGKPERELVQWMQRIPDSTYQPDAATKMMLWRVEIRRRDPGSAPSYVYVNRNTGIVPVGGTPARDWTETCNVQWLLIEGTARSYTLSGTGCP